MSETIEVYPTAEVTKIDGVTCRKWKQANSGNFLWVRTVWLDDKTAQRIKGDVLTTRDPDNPDAPARLLDPKTGYVREVPHED